MAGAWAQLPVPAAVVVVAYQQLAPLDRLRRVVMVVDLVVVPMEHLVYLWLVQVEEVVEKHRLLQPYLLEELASTVVAVAEGP